ncbi:hypothetical protein [Singulisphaera acidiphila]|uniref:Ferric reductase like transmembrane component n=1 Tax=Singulisphaera acidiphila (strain ATCC BAA-1392 / DSM 18658 / VKM B-2454 / MOB10) TaxID=886293 RepID=L0DJV2_SINAD|nr:hypothetical protein [Singulisphaera acidiphila]AGA29125.1 hypothetical protein Sinac_4969 [Singulisphaera acidiphila DSM 18658]
MLIDSRQKGWFLATVVLAFLTAIVYAWFDYSTPGGFNGGSVIGMWYGIIGYLLMVYAGLLSTLRKVPSLWWLGSRKVWLKGHIWLGLLSELVILFHSGFRWGGPLEQVLWVVLTLTIATGVIGLAFQQFLPRMITRRITCEVPYEQIPHLCALLRRKSDAIIDAICGSFDAPLAEAGAESPRAQLRQFYENEVRPFLGNPYLRKSPLATPGVLEAELAGISALSWTSDVDGPLKSLGALCEERRLLGEQERLHHLLHGWLVIHIPLSVALLVLGLAHAALSMYY